MVDSCREPYHTSGTTNEYPVVVDVDGDNDPKSSSTMIKVSM